MNDDSKTTNDWKEYRRMVLSDLERLTTSVEDIRICMGKIRSDIVMLKMKSGILGVMGGTAAAVVAIVFKLVH